MKLETCLEIQAYADGELDRSRRAALEEQLRTDPEAQELHAALTRLRAAVQDHEPAAVVPETREFYWSQIQRRIQAAEAAEQRPSVKSSSWLAHVSRWLVPVGALAAVALVFTVRNSHSTSPVLMASGDAAGANQSSVMYRSDADGVTIHWIN